MEKVMKAICVTAADGIQVKDVPQPVTAAPGHIIIKMAACGINPGDKAFIGGTFPGGGVALSKYDIYGVSGAGRVTDIGTGVPDSYRGKNVTVYRSLQASEDTVGTWSEYAQLPYRDCAILPDGVAAADYNGSLVNIITPFAFLKQVIAEGHKGIICTAGTSATGIAMLGVCVAYDFPLVSIVRDEDGKKELEALGAKHVVVQADGDFKAQLKEMTQALSATAVFDGVGGEILNVIIDVLPVDTTIYCYGYLGGKTPLTIHTSMLQRGLTIKRFSNFRSETVQQHLDEALADIGKIIHLPHFKTKVGKKFKLEEINEALQYTDANGGKPVLYPADVN